MCGYQNCERLEAPEMMFNCCVDISIYNLGRMDFCSKKMQQGLKVIAQRKNDSSESLFKKFFSLGYCASVDLARGIANPVINVKVT